MIGLFNRKIALAIGASILAMPSVAYAQQDTEVKTPGTDAFDTDIVVTARRSAETVQTVPVSVTAFNADSLRDAGIRSTVDLMVKTPGVFLGGSGGSENSNFAIRGQSKALAGNSAAAVVSYFAEVPMPTFGSGMPTYDISSVQVLKGPQGTLFGRNTTGGAILFYPTTPGYGIAGYAQATYGNYDNVELEAALTLPIVSDKVSLRVAGLVHRRDGYTKNLGLGGDLDNVHNDSFRATLLLEPTDWLKNITIYDYYKSATNGNGSSLVYVNPSVSPAANPLAAFGILSSALNEFSKQKIRGPRVVETDIAQFTRVKRQGITNRTEIDLGGAQFINIFGYRSTQLDYNQSADGIPTLFTDSTSFLGAGRPVTVVNGQLFSDVDQISDEVQFRGKAFNDKLDWLVGAFYLKSNPKGPSGTFIPIFIFPGAAAPVSSYSFYKEESKAAFANLQYEVLDGLKLNAGVRYTSDNISACVGTGLNSNQEVTPDECKTGSARILNSTTNKTKSNAWTYQVGLDWQASDDIFAYAVTRKGYRAGGVNSPSLAGRLTQFQSFQPETVQDVEIGLKTEFRAGDLKMRLNTSGFIGWYDGVQVPLSGLNTQRGCDATRTDNPNRFSPDGDCNPNNDPSGGTLLVNAGKSRVSGVDISGMIATNGGVSLNFGATLLDPKSRSVSVPATLLSYLASPEVPFNYAAKTTLNLGARWELPTPAALGQAVVSIDYYYSSEINHSDLVLPSYDVVNARFEIKNIGGSQLDGSIFVQNLFDKEYLAMGNVGSNKLGAMSAIYGAPQMYGLQLRYKFGM